MSPQSEKKKWQRFEEFVAAIQKSLAPNAKVEHNVKIKGSVGIDRQVDVCVRMDVGQYEIVIVMDCKDWKSAIDIKDVEEFAGLVQDVKANKGAMVCNAGFSKAAKDRAAQMGIDLFAAIDVQSVDWPAYMAIPVLCDFRRAKQFSFCFTGTGQFRMPNIDVRYLEVFDKDGQKIDILINLLIAAWNSHKISHEEGEHRDIVMVEQGAYTKLDDKIYGPVNITATVRVERSLYFGHIPITQGKGFKDEIKGSFVTNSFQTGDVDIVEVQKTWQRIANEGELSVMPLIRMVGADHMPMITEPNGRDSSQDETSAKR